MRIIYYAQYPTVFTVFCIGFGDGYRLRGVGGCTELSAVALTSFEIILAKGIR